MGDLTFVHDATGLLIGPGEPRPSICGSSSPTTTAAVSSGCSNKVTPLQHRSVRGAYERVFGTPHRTDLAALCAGFHIAHRRVSLGELSGYLQTEVPGGPEVVEVSTDRARLRDLHAAIAARYREIP